MFQRAPPAPSGGRRLPIAPAQTRAPGPVTELSAGPACQRAQHPSTPPCCPRWSVISGPSDPMATATTTTAPAAVLIAVAPGSRDTRAISKRGRRICLSAVCPSLPSALCLSADTRTRRRARRLPGELVEAGGSGGMSPFVTCHDRAQAEQQVRPGVSGGVLLQLPVSHATIHPQLPQLIPSPGLGPQATRMSPDGRLG
ncbi:unnamed protein product [Arctogadus glacialis]